jgi:uncharacterized membrane protein/protein-disulfide isomerase
MPAHKGIRGFTFHQLQQTHDGVSGLSHHKGDGYNRMKPKKTIVPYPFSVYFLTALFLGLCGLAVSVYLATSHYRVYTDIAYSSFCALSRSINCDTVSQSPYSIFLDLPLPIWGIIGYSFVLALLFFCWKDKTRNRLWSTLILVLGVFCIHSLVLAWISAFRIHSYCAMCILSYAVNFLLLFTAWLIHTRFVRCAFSQSLRGDITHMVRHRNHALVFLLVFLSLYPLLRWMVPTYWVFAPPPLAETVPTGQTSEGHPWIGAVEPSLTITEYTDYKCFQCRKMHYFLRQLIQRYPDKIRLVHRHFPMERKFNPLVTTAYHPGSGTMALFAEYANTMDRFWEMNDLLFQYVSSRKAINSSELAEKTGLDPSILAAVPRNTALRYRIKHDIATGIALGITGTPGYVIHDKVYIGNIPAELLESISR